MEANLTQRFLEAVRPPATGQIFVRDRELTGLALRITQNGAKSFVWEGRIKGRPRRITLGQYPGMSVLLARRKALEVKTAIAQGENPAFERIRARHERTFGGLAAEYLERHAKPHKKSWREDEGILSRIPHAWR